MRVGPRGVLGGACLAFLLVPWADPVSVGGVLTLLGGAAAVWTVARPGSLGPLLLLGIGVVLWLLVVADPGWGRVLLFGAAGYAVHAVAALNAAVPAGVRLDARTWWVAVARGGLALGLSSLAVVTGARLAPPNASATLLTVVVALALVVAAAAVALPRLVARWSRH